MNKYAFGNNLVPVMKKKRITQTDLAQNLGVHVNSVSRWIRGESPVPSDKLFMISRFVGVSMDDLMKGCDDEALYDHDR